MKRPLSLLLALTALPSTLCAMGIGEIFQSDTACEYLTARSERAIWGGGCNNPSVPRTQIVSKYPGPTRNLIFHPEGCASDEMLISEVGYRDGFVWWMDGDGAIWRAAGPLSRTTVAQAEDAAGMLGRAALDIGEDYVVWSESSGEFGEVGRLFRALSDGSGPREFIQDLSGPGIRDLIAVSDTFILVHTLNNRLLVVYRAVQFDPMGGTSYVWTPFELAATVTAFAFDRRGGGRIHWIENSGTASPYRLRSSGLFNPNVLPITPDYQTNYTAGNALYEVTELAVYARRIFWHERRSALSGPIQRLRPGEVVPSEITSVITDANPMHLCAAGRRIFWRENLTTIRSLNADADAFALDLRATNLSPIQVAQGGPGLPVPMVSGKPTIVRLFGIIETDSAGIGSVRPGALLRGRIPGGAELPGSPLQPVNRDGTIDGTLSDLADPNEGFIFRLPREWTLEPSIDLTGVLNPTNVFPETDTTNNVFTRNLIFNRKAPHVVSMFGIRIASGLPHLNTYSPWMQPIFDRCEALLPGSSLKILWKDHVMEKWIIPPFWAEPYQLGGRGQDPAIDNDAWLLVAALQFVWLFDSAQLEVASPLNARLHACSMIPPGHTNWGTSSSTNFGLAGRATNNLVFLARWRDGARPFSTALGGVTFAHELAHNFDRAHNGMTGSPANPDTSYPYGDFCGDSSTYGWDSVSNRLVRFDQAGDLMSYNSERFTSEYTYRSIYSWLGDLPPGAPAGTAPPKTLRPTKGEAPRKGIQQDGCLLVFGAIDPHTGQWHLRFPYPLDESQAGFATGMMEFASELGSYAVCALDKEGKEMYQEPVAFFTNEEGPGTTIWACLPIDPLVAEYVIKESETGTVVGTLTAGPNPPTVAILKPLAFDFFDAPFPVEWIGQDPDGDPLRYLVEFSNNDGATWTIVQADTGRTQLTLDESGMLPGGAKCRIRVTANDGLHTATVISDEFAVEDKSPQAWLFFDTSRTGKVCTAPELSVNVGETVRVHATAYDPEDGPLTGPSLTWSFTGPVSGAGTGEIFTMPDLPSGTYTVTLSAVDGGGQGDAAVGILTVLPKYLESGPAPVLDGLGTDPSYQTDPFPVSLHYLDGTVADARAVHSGSKLFVSVSGMPLGGFGSERIVIGIDRDNNGTGTTSADDRFFVMYSTGQLALGTGNGSGFTESDPEGFNALLQSDGTTWQAEFCIEDSALGGWDGRPVGLIVAHLDQLASGWNTHWPNGANRFNPSTWNPAVLGPHPNDPTDSDADQIADGWEIAHFGDLSRDGTGDADHDGQSDFDEFITGHDPHDFTSLSQLQIIPGTNTLKWPSVVGRHYQLLRSTDLQAWEPVGPARAGDGSTFNFTDPDPPAPRAFYQLSISYCQ